MRTKKEKRRKNKWGLKSEKSISGIMNTSNSHIPLIYFHKYN